MQHRNAHGSALTFSAALILSSIIVACHSYNAGVVTGVNDDPNIRYGPAPAVFPAGAQMAVLQGDPSKSEPFTVRLRFPDGYVVSPHTHPTDEHITVIDGTFKVGMGGTFNESSTVALRTGGFVTAPAQHAHFAKAQGATTVQVTAVGPFVLTYVNPADLPAGAR